jgi:glycosyltransferase involved in cell wall biosynthesis
MLEVDMDLSVIIPLYNKKDTVQRAIDSILNQTVLPNEIIVVNDGSTDGSEKIVEAIHHPLIKLIHQENAGVSAARNKGIEFAKSEWVAFLDADDYWDERYLETIRELHFNYPEAKVLATNYRYLLHTGEIKESKINNLSFGNKKHGILDNYFQVASTSNPPICSSAVVAFKKELQSIGSFPLGIKSGEDLLTWSRLALRNVIAYDIHALATFVLDPAHSYNDKPNRTPQHPDFVGQELKKLYQNNRSVNGLRKYIAHWHKMRASVYLRLGKRGRSFKEIMKSLSYAPFQPKIWMYVVLLVMPDFMINRLFKMRT